VSTSQGEGAAPDAQAAASSGMMGYAIEPWSFVAMRFGLGLLAGLICVIREQPTQLAALSRRLGQCIGGFCVCLMLMAVAILKLPLISMTGDYMSKEREIH
jgi:hypothetical protein